MTNNRVVSVIIPVYNVETYIKQCLESVIHQTYQELDIIIVDDGSIDMSGVICRQYASCDKRVRIIKQSNAGLSAARNTGLQNARGEYIVFVDSDDWLDVDMVRRMVEALEKRKADIAVCGFAVVKKRKTTYCNVHEEKLLTSEAALRLLCKDEQIKNYAWGKLYRKKIFETLRFEIGKKFEDIYIMYQCFEQATKIVVIPDIGCYYRIRRNSISQQHSAETGEQRCLAHIARYEHFDPSNIECRQILLQQAFYAYRKCVLNAKNTNVANHKIRKWFLEQQEKLETLILLNNIEKKEVQLLKKPDSYYKLLGYELLRKVGKVIRGIK